jgi:hypothetical protein
MKNLNTSIKILIVAFVFIPGYIWAQDSLSTDTTLESDTNLITEEEIKDGEVRITTTDTETGDETRFELKEKSDGSVEVKEEIRTEDKVVKTETDIVDGEYEVRTDIKTDDGTTEIEIKEEARVDSDGAEQRFQIRTEVDEVDEVDQVDEETFNRFRLVSDNISDISESSKSLESDLREEIKNTIDKSILTIRAQIDIQAFELQRVVDNTRNQIHKDIENTLLDLRLDGDVLDDLEDRIIESLESIKSSLEEFSGVELDISNNIGSIKELIDSYDNLTEQNTSILVESEANLMLVDSDDDGLSDYDEKYVYNTDPNNAKTVDGELTDSEKVERGINPTSTSSEPIRYSDPRNDTTSHISKIHKVEEVELVTDDDTQERRLRLKGAGLPNSYVTVYIYSTPTIVTVKTDERGKWTYTLDEELENGEHDVYVATVDNSGRLVARSESFPLTQSAEAAALGIFGINETSPTENDFIQENFILIIVTILLLAVIATLIISGSRPEDKLETVGNLGDENDNVTPEPESNMTSESSETTKQEDNNIK